MYKFFVSFACFLLKKELPLSEKNRLTRAILQNLDALPLEDVFQTNTEGELVVKGKVISPSEVRILQESAASALRNRAFILIREQVIYEALVHGVHKANGDSGQLFMRAALWWEQKQEEKLRSLAGSSSLS